VPLAGGGRVLQPIAPPKRDPAPSRTSYRIQRLWLTPIFRAILRTGVPVFSVIFLAGWYVSDATRIDAIRASVTQIRSNIEHRPEFMVNLMRIEDVSAEVAEDIREVTAIDFPVSSFDLDLEEIRTRIMELDAVAQAKLVVRPGGVLDVELRERVPAIIWRGRDVLELLDGNGHRVAALDVRKGRTDLPLIAGENADLAVPEALALFAAAQPIEARMRGLLRVGARRWDVVLDRQQRIMLPETNAVAALENILALNEINDLLARDLVVIDLRDISRPTLRLGDQAVRALHGLPTDDDGDDNL
jgi:cell division protein FtsQ